MIGDREVIVCDPAMVLIFDRLKELAATDVPVLISGGPGVGKEMAAYALHHYSARSAKPYIHFYCQSFAQSQAEGELFGHDKSSVGAKPAAFETASGGTLLLAEVAELGLPVQARLVRVLAAQHPGNEVDVRIVATVTGAVEPEAKYGLHQDLYARLSVARVQIPPLRDRKSEIPGLFRLFLAQEAKRENRNPPTPSSAELERLASRDWGANVRELRQAAMYLLFTGQAME